MARGLEYNVDTKQVTASDVKLWATFLKCLIHTLRKYIDPRLSKLLQIQADDSSFCVFSHDRMKYAIRAGKAIHLLKPVSHCIYKCFYKCELALDCYSIQNTLSTPQVHKRQSYRLNTLEATPGSDKKFQTLNFGGPEVQMKSMRKIRG